MCWASTGGCCSSESRNDCNKGAHTSRPCCIPLPRVHAPPPPPTRSSSPPPPPPFPAARTRCCATPAASPSCASWPWASWRQRQRSPPRVTWRRWSARWQATRRCARCCCRRWTATEGGPERLAGARGCPGAAACLPACLACLLAAALARWRHIPPRLLHPAARAPAPTQPAVHCGSERAHRRLARPTPGGARRRWGQGAGQALSADMLAWQQAAGRGACCRREVPSSTHLSPVHPSSRPAYPAL